MFKNGLVVFILFIVSTLSLFSQEQILDSSKIVMPVYKGGKEAMNRDISKHLDYPTLAMEQGIQGTVIVSFLVNEKGKVTDVKIVQSVHPLLDQAAITAVKKLRRFKPGTYEGKPVKLWITVPVTFKLYFNEQ